MIQPSDIEAFDYKKAIICNIIDYDSNISNNIITEEKKTRNFKIE